MVLDNKKAYEDFETIRTTLEQSKKNYGGFSILLFQYGFIQLILIVLSYALGSLIFYDSRYSMILFALEIIFDLYMIVLFLKIFRDEKLTSNKYYLSCISMWGLITISLPIISLVVRVTVIFFASNVSNSAMVKLVASTGDIDILLFCFAALICGFITNKKAYIAMSIVILFTYLELSALFFDTSLSALGEQVLYIFYNTIISVGYIVLSIILRRGIKNGY